MMCKKFQENGSWETEECLWRYLWSFLSLRSHVKMSGGHTVLLLNLTISERICVLNVKPSLCYLQNTAFMSSSILFTYMLSFWRLSLHYSGLIDVWPSQWPLHPNFIMLSTNTSTQSWNGTSSYSPWEQCNLSTKLILLKRDCRQLPKLEQIPTNEIFDI